MVGGFDITTVRDDVFRKSLDQFPDMPTRIQEFEKTLDVTYISEPGLILQTFFLE
jgi:hypothetical protein